ncbi:uncharacterized protein PAC_05224 [Phialocephala subalpina]|uniref:Uncharacterized protein n=1 Tax=Phialocephala subalpina TaxID=576137 RepID=A0A1L7WRE0_9HELO|nr:uncharacterized protein PAC_05224 [Phialocephala subalpina]
MPSFFDFQQGNETHGPATDSSPLLGRFRAVPDAQRHGSRSHRNSLLGLWIGRGSGGYGSVFASNDDDDDEDDLADSEDMGRLRRWGRIQRDLWLEPRQAVVAKLVDKWWSRWALLAVLPAALAVAWCAVPIPQYPLDDDDFMGNSTAGWRAHKIPGHGAARVEINFWFFLFVYYGIYNLTALLWITKVFNIYSLNWWPETLGFPLTVSLLFMIALAVPIPMYYFTDLRDFTGYNTLWICWTFFTMAMPLMLAFGILLNHERHLGLRNSLSETQRIFTSSWWTGETETIAARSRPRRANINQSYYDPDAPLEVALATGDANMNQRNLALRKRWIPASFMRFIWFCAALYVAMMAYVLGEAYAETYLRTLPHNTIQTITYVYTWVLTINLLDGLTGWILGGKEGERTYVRALYARLRSPKQFILLQVLSSSFLIILFPLSMSAPFHYVLTILGINGQTRQEYQKFCARNIFIRGLSENVSMLAFLGSILVLHYGANKEIYPYFAFDKVTTPIPDPTDGGIPISDGSEYDFGLTFYASSVTWACEMVAAWIVRRIIMYGWKINVTGEAKQDLGTWPELLPTGVVVMFHVLQNMLFSIARLKFH